MERKGTVYSLQSPGKLKFFTSQEILKQSAFQLKIDQAKVLADNNANARNIRNTVSSPKLERRNQNGLETETTNKRETLLF